MNVRTLRCLPTKLATLLALAGCGEAVYDTIKVMPPPAVYIDGEVDPFPRVTTQTYAEKSRLFYVTERRPATEEDPQRFYANARGFALRAGEVRVQADPPYSGWDEVREISISQEGNPRKRSLRISDVTEYGFLPLEQISVLPFQGSESQNASAGQQFAQAIDQKLANSVQKDIFIYVHGYNVDFDYPVLASKELQHYLGYRGAFLTYAWPATPNRLAYFKDLETADATRKNLRETIVFLSQNTRAENIHIIGYSAGSRLAFEAVYDLTLRYPPGRADAPRLGKLIMIGSDVDRAYFAQALDDGVLRSTDEVVVYMSSTDSALRMSSLVLGQDRLGQVFIAEGAEERAIEQKIRTLDNLTMIDVTDAEGSAFGNGHAYFRSSPWASSDMFVSLIYGIGPAERGLLRAPEGAVWTFPDDYPERIVDAVKRRAQ